MFAPLVFMVACMLWSPEWQGIVNIITANAFAYALVKTSLLDEPSSLHLSQVSIAR